MKAFNSTIGDRPLAGERQAVEQTGKKLGMHKHGSFTEAESKVIITAIVKKTGLSRADAEKIFVSTGARRSKRRPVLERQWVRTLEAVCDDLREARADPSGLYETTFWIRLFGAITELRSRFESSAQSHYDLVASGRSHPFFAASAAVFEACTALRDSLSDDQLAFVAFARHVHAHVYQDGFEYSLQRGNPAKNQPASLRTKQMIPTVGRHVDVDEAHAIFDRVSAKYGHDEARIAVNFAHIVGPHVERLGVAMEALEREREKDRFDTAKILGVAAD